MRTKLSIEEIKMLMKKEIDKISSSDELSFSVDFFKAGQEDEVNVGFNILVNRDIKYEDDEE